MVAATFQESSTRAKNQNRKLQEVVEDRNEMTKRREDQVPWFFFPFFLASCFSSRVSDHFLSVRFFHSSGKGLVPLFCTAPTLTSSSVNNEDYERWWRIFMSLRSDDFTTLFYCLHAKDEGKEPWQDACHVLATRTSCYFSQVFRFLLPE